jgi:hypothetical protein
MQASEIFANKFWKESRQLWEESFIISHIYSIVCDSFFEMDGSLNVTFKKPQLQ